MRRIFTGARRERPVCRSGVAAASYRPTICVMPFCRGRVSAPKKEKIRIILRVETVVILTIVSDDVTKKDGRKLLKITIAEFCNLWYHTNIRTNGHYSTK